MLIDSAGRDNPPTGFLFFAQLGNIFNLYGWKMLIFSHYKSNGVNDARIKRGAAYFESIKKTKKEVSTIPVLQKLKHLLFQYVKNVNTNYE